MLQIPFQQILKTYEVHLLQATVECSTYREICRETRDLYKEHIESLSPSASSSAVHGPGRSCSALHKAYYSFHFPQQVHLPSDPLQPGPMYFLTPGKCALFGISCEAVPYLVKLRNKYM